MGLDMYLKRAILHGYSIKQAEAANAYLTMMQNNEENPEDQCNSISKWAGVDDSLLDMGAVEALRPELQATYFDLDVNKLFPQYDIFVQVGYWRKANAIHHWFVQNVQNGVDDCQSYAVSREQLEALRGLCESVISGNVKPKKALPVYDGFYFGTQKYDDSYFQDLRDTIAIVDKVVAETDWDIQTVCYEASW